MRRAVVVALAGVLLGVVLGLLRLQANVREELEGARAQAELGALLAQLPRQADAPALAALRQWQASGELRHLRLSLRDAHGAELLAPHAGPDDASPQASLALLDHLSNLSTWLPAPEPFTVSWPVARPDGAHWQVSLHAEPANEQREAWAFMLEGVALLALVAALMLLVMRWNIRRALQPLGALLAAIGELGQGRRGALLNPPALRVAELHAIGTALRELAQALGEAEQRQRGLVQQLIRVQDDERQRLARELHDEFGQHLTALRVDAAWLLRQLEDRPAAHGVLAGMAAQLERIQQDIRSLLARLRPLPEATGLTPSQQLAQLGEQLAALVAGWQRAAGASTRYGLALRVEDAQGCPAGWPPQAVAVLPEGLCATLYRISQEALTNVARHADARQVQLDLLWQCPAQDGAPARLRWEVRDDGRGVADLAAAMLRGNGLAGLQERLWAQGAELRGEAVAQAEAERPGLCLSARWELTP